MKFVFFNFPAYGHVNPTLAIVEELVSRGETVVYYLSEQFRRPIEATGATFRAYQLDLFSHGQTPDVHPVDINRRLAMLPAALIQQSATMVPRLVESVRAEQADCIVYDSMFFWARCVAHILQLPAVGLRPTYASNQYRKPFARLARFSPPSSIAALNDELARLSATYNLPFPDMRSLHAFVEPLTIVFLPRSFQPDGETFDERFLFVGPSLQPQRHEDNPFPRELLDEQPCLYISLGTVINNQVDFYRLCFEAFADTEWRVILPVGQHVDRSIFSVIPRNFIVVPYVSQLEVLKRARIFISHGGMNSVMESLYYGVPLIVIPHQDEQEITAQRIQELKLGIALPRQTLNVPALREAVARITHDPAFYENARTMQRDIHEAGGYQRATDAIIRYARSAAQK